MVKIKTISRSADNHIRSTSSSLDPVYSNPDPSIHPFERPREYVRALNATKLDKVFSQPFLAALSGHRDGVYALRRHPTDIQFVVSGSGDGEIRIWHLPSKETRWRIPSAHNGLVRSVVYGKEDRVLSVGTDKIIKCWNPHGTFQTLENSGESYDYQAASMRAYVAGSSSLYDDLDPNQTPPIATWSGDDIFTALDHQRSASGLGSKFATGSASKVQIWSYQRSEATQTHEWGSGSITSLSFNPIETNILAATTQDRDINFLDVRGVTPIRKLTLQMRSNIVAWNPLEAYNFTVANEDHNCYTFDIRKLSCALNIHRDHVGAIIALDYSPTGREFATGAYDRTIRIFNPNESRSTQVYHTKRMQKIFGIQYSGDANYILSASDDANIRIWKAHASAPIGVLLPREKRQLAYKTKLMQRYKDVPELRRITHHQHVPRLILKAQKKKRVMKEAQARKQQRIYLHSKQRVRLAKDRERIVVEEK